MLWNFSRLYCFFVVYASKNKELELRKKREKERLEEEKREREQNSLKNEIDNIKRRIREDFQRFPYSDKLKTTDGKIRYTFENKNWVEVSRGQIVYETNTHRVGYGVGLLTDLEFHLLFTEIFSIAKRRNASATNSGDARWKRYYTIMETIALRKESLSKMKHNDPDRDELVYELRVAEAKAKKIKEEIEK